MIRVERQAVGHGGRWHWRYGVGPLSGFSSEPLLDACRKLQRIGVPPPEEVGLRLRGVSRVREAGPSMRLRN